MPRTLGVHCDTNNINFAIVEDDVVLDGMPERIRTPVGLEEHDRLWALLEEVEHVIELTRCTFVAILAPEQTYEATHSEFTPRIGRETVVRMAASRRNIPVSMLARVTVKSRLGLPVRGRLDSHLDEAVPKSVGRYWRSGRGLAAMAALAAEAG